METTPVDPQSLLRVNTLTAGPLLRLLLALEGMEPPDIDPARAWQVFRRFLALPSESVQDVASFQARWEGETGDAPVLFCTFVRQLTDEDPDAIAPRTRSIELEYSYDVPRVDQLPELDVWSDSYRSLDEFAAHVERLPHFRLMEREGASFCDIFVEDMEEGLSDAPEPGR